MQAELAGMPSTCTELLALTTLLTLNGVAPPVQLTVNSKTRAGSGLGPPVTVLVTVKLPGSGEKTAAELWSLVTLFKVQMAG